MAATEERNTEQNVPPDYPSVVLWPGEAEELVLRPAPRSPLEPRCFRMGSRGGPIEEEPIHTVEFDCVGDSDPTDVEGRQARFPAFWIGEAPITVGQYRRWLKTGEYEAWRESAHPEARSGGARVGGDAMPEEPVTEVTWWEAVGFSEWLRTQGPVTWLPQAFEGPSVAALNVVWSVPTEAHWEFACRAGTTTEFSFGDRGDALGEVAWFVENSGVGLHPVKGKRPNAWRLYDMHGLVWEWCSDEWDADAYRRRRPGVPGSSGGITSSSTFRVLRGGSWWNSARLCRSAYRSTGWLPRSRSDAHGFRVCLLPGPAVSTPRGGAPAKERAET